jgi:hypothetical protein
MPVANPIYDAVFKYLMKNEKGAKLFLSVIIDEAKDKSLKEKNKVIEELN